MVTDAIASDTRQPGDILTMTSVNPFAVYVERLGELTLSVAERIVTLSDFCR